MSHFLLTTCVGRGNINLFEKRDIDSIVVIVKGPIVKPDDLWWGKNLVRWQWRQRPSARCFHHGLSFRSSDG